MYMSTHMLKRHAIQNILSTRQGNTLLRHIGLLCDKLCSTCWLDRIWKACATTMFSATSGKVMAWMETQDVKHRNIRIRMWGFSPPFDRHTF